MILLHHLRVGRSMFTVWQLEELGVIYEIKIYHRDPATFRAQDDLKAVHPLGKRSEERRVGKECRARWSPDP